MAKTRTGRAIVHYPYESRTSGKTYNSIILCLEKTSGRYSLPGGKFKPKSDSDTFDTAAREVEEELGLRVSRLFFQKAFEFTGNECRHDIYVVEAEGTLDIDKHELKGIGFFNAGRHNQIPSNLLEAHVKALVSEYSRMGYKKTNSGIVIPGHYFAGSTDPRIIDWSTQRNSF